MQALQPPRQQRAPPQLGSHYHGVEDQRALWGEEQRLPSPLQPSESYPKYPLYLTEKKHRGSVSGKKKEQSGLRVTKRKQTVSYWMIFSLDCFQIQAFLT